MEKKETEIFVMNDFTKDWKAEQVTAHTLQYFAAGLNCYTHATFFFSSKELREAGTSFPTSLDHCFTFLLLFLLLFSIAVQLLLSAENLGEVYIKSTESGHYLAMDANGRLYGSVSMRFLWVWDWGRF